MSIPAFSDPFTHLHSGLASASFPTEQAAWVVGDWCVFTDETLLRYEVYVDGVNQRTFVNNDTWESLDGEALVAFESDFMTTTSGEAVTGLRFMCTDSGPYGEAARQQAEAAGSSVVLAKDRITQIAERADALIIQAASLNSAATEVQLQAFAVRHARLVEDMAALERDMMRLRSVIQLAGTALVDVSTL